VSEIDPLDEALRRTARAFNDPPRGAAGEPGAERLGEVRARSAHRRRTRHRAVSGLAMGMIAVAVFGVLRLPGTGGGGGQVGTEGDSPSTTAPAVPGSGPGTVVPGTAGDPGTSTSTTGTTVPGASTTTTTTTLTPDGQTGPGANPQTGGKVPTPTPTPVGGPVQFSNDGLGIIRFGDELEPALAALTAALGPPSQPGTTSSGGNCGITGQRFVFWNNLSVDFYDRGSGLRFAGYEYGQPISRQGNGHPAPTGPVSPVVGNPWGLRLGGSVPSVDTLLAQVQVAYPDATSGKINPASDDQIIGMMLTGTYRANIDVHSTPGGGGVVERFLVWSMPDITCR
jgi:hypothetical protein